MQLKNGKMMLYYFIDYYDINIYDEKTFKKLLEIYLYKTIYEYKLEKIK